MHELKASALLPECTKLALYAQKLVSKILTQPLVFNTFNVQLCDRF